MKQYCLACDLKEEESLIREYEDYHRKVWPEIKQGLGESGIEVMEIYRTGNRLFMIMKTTADFDFAKKAAMDTANPIVQKWEEQMGIYQQAIPWAEYGVKWVLMERIFLFESNSLV